jgi:pimeloyl-ACP methyl ester carboxylesterase
VTSPTTGRELAMNVRTGDGVVLAGTLALPPATTAPPTPTTAPPNGPMVPAPQPAGPDPAGPYPAALLLPGSGPVDRDSNAGRRKLAVTRELARALAERGVASFRYDRRGTGSTPGDWRAAGFVQNREDAAAALAAMRERPEVRPDAVAVVGHSEGALHAAALAAHHDVAAAVLLAPAAHPGEDVLRWQARNIAGDLPRPVRLVLRLLRTDLLRHQAKTLAKIRRTTTDVARVGGARINARWHREFLAHDPRPDLAAIRVPVLAVTGDKDVQVDPDDLAVIADLVPGPVEIRRIPDLTHLLRHEPGPASVRGYRRQLRRPVHPELVGAVAIWVAAALSPAPTP